jgi:hypothetical protein
MVDLFPRRKKKVFGEKKRIKRDKLKLTESGEKRSSFSE